MPRAAAVILGLAVLVPSVVRADDRERDLRALIRELGHEKWTNRETAQTLLLKKGEPILKLLKEAAESRDPELARRARELRERLDPLIGAFEIVEIELGSDVLESASQVVAVARGSGQSGKTLQLDAKSRFGRAAKSPTSSRSSRTTRRFTVSWRAIASGAYDVEVEEGSSNSTTKTRLRRPLGMPAAVSLLKVGEKARYVRQEVLGERERHPFVILLRQRFIRRSDHDETTVADEDRDTILRNLVATLKGQARRGGALERAQALDLLGRLRARECADLFVDALEHDDTRIAGALALAELGRPEGHPDLLSLLESDEQLLAPDPGLDQGTGVDESVSRGGTADFTKRGREASQRVRAATLLAHAGDQRGLTYLLAKLESRDVVDAFAVLATLSDLQPRLAEVEELRVRLLSNALRADSITEAPWTFFPLETEHFYLRALELLDAKKSDDREMAAAAVQGFESLAAGRGNVAQVPPTSVLPLWKLAARIASASDEASPDTPPEAAVEQANEIRFLERALADVNTSAGISEIVSRIQSTYAGRTLPTSFLVALFSALERSVASADANLRSIARRRARDISSSLVITSGQLKTVVEGLLAIETAEPSAAGASRSSTSSAYSLRNDLISWSGVAVAAARSRAKTDVFAPLRTWLANEEKVLAREKEILARQKKARAETTRLVYYEFDLQTAASPSANDVNQEDGDAKDGKCQVHSALRAVVRPDVTTVIDDAGGLSRSVRLAALTSKSSISRVTRSRNPLRRFRVNGSTLLTVGVFHTSSSMTRTAAPGESWNEVSDIEPRARSIRRSPGSSSQRIVLVAEESAEPALDPSTLPAPGPERVVAIWQHFIEHHVLNLPENPSAFFRSSYVRVVRMIRDPRSVLPLKGLLTSHGSVDIAGLLHELGDPAGLEFLKRQLETNVVSSKIQAARAITDIGDTAGIDALFELEESKPLDFARQSYSVLASFEKFVASRDPNDATRIRVLDFVFSKLSEARYQSPGFRVVKRVAGSDFGYSLSRNVGAVSTGAKRRSPTESRQAREKAIADARAWWNTERSKVAKDD